MDCPGGDTRRGAREMKERGGGPGPAAAACRFGTRLRNDSVPVAVRVAGDGALDAVPGVADGGLGAVPGQAGPALALVPATGQIGLDAVERAALPAVLCVALPAVAVRRGVFVVGGGAVGVRALGVVLAPVGILGGGVDG